MWIGEVVDLHGDGMRRRPRPCDNNVNPGVSMCARNVTSYRCLSRPGSGRFADCFQISWELVVSAPGDPVVMYADIEGVSDNPRPMG